MLAKSWMMSCRHVIWQVGTTFFSQCRANIPNILPTCQHVLGWHVIWGGVGDVTQRQHFQLSFTAQVAIEHEFYIYNSIHCYPANEFLDPGCL